MTNAGRPTTDARRLGKDLLRFSEDAARLDGRAGHLSVAPQQVFLVVRGGFGDEHRNAHDEVAAPALTESSEALAAETDPTSRLTFGKSLGGNVDVTFSQSFRDSSAQTWIVDYLPSRQVALRLISHDDDLRSYELRHDVSFSRVLMRPASDHRPDFVAKEELLLERSLEHVVLAIDDRAPGQVDK